MNSKFISSSILAIALCAGTLYAKSAAYTKISNKYPEISSEKQYRSFKNDMTPLAKKGDIDALFSLGNLAMSFSTKQEALQWFELAAKQGDSNAQARVGGMYRLGIGTSKDLNRAHGWIDLSVKKSNPSGIAELAMIYRDGAGVKQDLQEYFKLIKRAAEKDVNAEVYDSKTGNQIPVYESIANAYRYGIGTSKNEKQAQYWENHPDIIDYGI